MALVNEFNERLLKIINELAEDEARFNKSYIPIEWIKKWQANHPMEITDRNLVIVNLLDDWEKENEPQI